MIWLRKLLWTVLKWDYSKNCLVEVKWRSHQTVVGWWGRCIKCDYHHFTYGNEKDAEERAKWLSKNWECQ